MLEVKSIDISYDAIRAVRGVSLSVEEGEIVALLGANGAGKSTTLKGIMGLVGKRGGTVTFDGVDVTKQAPERLVRRGMTLTPEGRNVFATLTVRENLTLGAAVIGKRVADERRERMLEVFPILKSRERQLAGTLSGGEQQQLAIARSLMSGPRLLLLDEPSLGLAPIIVTAMFELIRKLREEGLTILLVEQNVSQTLQIADRAYVMATGEIAMVGSAEELAQTEGVQRAYLGLAVE
jgi:branched-chain amino acid transport system ATP-binding protein